MVTSHQTTGHEVDETQNLKETKKICPFFKKEQEPLNRNVTIIMKKVNVLSQILTFLILFPEKIKYIRFIALSELDNMLVLIDCVAFLAGLA